MSQLSTTVLIENTNGQHTTNSYKTQEAVPIRIGESCDLHWADGFDLKTTDISFLYEAVQLLPGANWWLRIESCADGSHHALIGNSRWSYSNHALMIVAKPNGFAAIDQRDEDITTDFATMLDLCKVLSHLLL